MNLTNSNLSYSINYLDSLASYKMSKYISKFLNYYLFDHWIILCIGTDRSTGDALGPFVGSKLNLNQMKGFTVIGTLENPIHAINLKDTIDMIDTKYPNSGVIAIDSCLGHINSVGEIQINSGPLRPGAGVKKELPKIGHFHITGIVNIGGFMEYFVLQNTRLSLVIKMSEIISSSLIKSSYITKKCQV